MQSLRLMPTLGGAAILAGLFALSTGSAQAKPLPPPDQKANPQMKAVLTELARLNPVPPYKLTPAQVRKNPGPPDAVKAVLKKQGKSTAPEPVATVQDTTVPGRWDRATECEPCLTIRFFAVRGSASPKVRKNPIFSVS